MDEEIRQHLDRITLVETWAIASGHSRVAEACRLTANIIMEEVVCPVQCIDAYEVLHEE